MRLLISCILLLLIQCTPVVSVEGQLEGPNPTKWYCGIYSVIFVFIMLPYWGRDGIDPVIAYVACWTIMGCWTLYGIAN